MKKQKATSKEPLLYIQQPKLEEVKGNMQVIYRSTKSKEKKEPTAEKIKETRMDHVVEPKSRLEEVNESSKPGAETDKEVPKSSSYSFRRLKPFKELNLEEKLEYINASINGKVPFPCEFKTDDASYKGVLTSMDEAGIAIKTFQGEEVSIPKNELKSIKMVGLH
ncbi:spore coat CotO family protein [Rossellomorea aquimaris]|uniref:CotO family spore coat protein n=1 Tax=Rossellomorea aquimaris TaxID=189382 RepID=UPI001CD3C41F|nr:CotO family spore coat protein [Rossellomorea aquimaris]MCA1056717.1 spore coat CotO family protein [Rossellomorea aquimaris]